jgi:hypothetical protein
MKKQFFSIILLVLVISGCTTRQYYEPKDTVSSNMDDKSLDYSISQEYNSVFQKDNGQIVDNRFDKKYIAKNGIALFRLINADNDHIIRADRSGKVDIIERKSAKSTSYDTNSPVLSATFKNDLIAILHYDNSISLFDTQSQKIIFKSYQSKAYTVDEKVANPFFMDDIILYPTINGNVVIVSRDKKALVKTITIDTKDRFANIKFLNVLDEKLIMASPHTIMSLSSNQNNKHNYDIRQIFIKDNLIYLSTLDGQIIKLDSNLDVIYKSKLKFGRINAIGFGKKYFYAYESEEYLVQFDEKLQIKNIFEYSKWDSDKIFIFDNTLHIGTEAIELE